MNVRWLALALGLGPGGGCTHRCIDYQWDDASLGPDHDVVTIDFRRAEGQTGDPYLGATRLVVTFDYLACLNDFYAANASWRQTGTDGAPVFDAAFDVLCDFDLLTPADCEVVDVAQRLDPGGGGDLTVEYAVRGSLDERTVAFGPLPTQGLAACANGGRPEVRVASNSAVAGFDAAGTLVWETKSFDPDRAAVGQGLAITIRAGLPD